MPWKMTFPEDQRVQFIVEALYGESSLADLCRSFAISRKTGYKWLARYDQEGPLGLIDRPRTPHDHPHALASGVAARLLAVRQKHPTWGARKLLAWLRKREPELQLPAVSTVNALLKRLNLVHPRRFRHRVPPMTAPFGSCAAPNDTWCVDFKGWFRVGDGSRCDPLTISDAFSRFIVRAESVPGTGTEDVRPVFEAAFNEYGLPNAIRSDNGPPFASRGVGGLSRLSVWWVRLGITPERIERGCPEQNGRHERMHQTLKAETARPPRQTLHAQQLAFDRFRHIFNYERPHEALGQQPPATVYEPSLRRMPLYLPEMTYPDHFEVRHANKSGGIKWNSRHVYISEALAGEYVGIEEIGDGVWLARFGPVELGRLKDDAPQLGLIRPPSRGPRHRHPR